MATTEKVVLDGSKAYTIDTEDSTDVLDGLGFHLLDVRRKLENFNSTAVTGYTMSVITDADEILAYKFLAAAGGYAVFPLYSGTETETFEGYLTILDAAGKVCSLDGAIYLGVAETAGDDFVSEIIDYLSDPVKAAEFITAADSDVLTDAIALAKTLVRFTSA